MRHLRNITISMMTMLYLAAGLGYGLHICESEGSVTPLIMLEDTSCESVHDHSHHHHCSGDHTSGCHSEGNCCHTEVYQLKDIYEAVTSFQIEQPSELLLPIALLGGIDLDYLALSPSLSDELVEYDPPEPLSESFHSLNSVWRL